MNTDKLISKEIVLRAYADTCLEESKNIIVTIISRPRFEPWTSHQISGLMVPGYLCRL